MNQKTNVIKKNDLEKYEVLLPFYAAIGKRRKNYLCSELEKMHPCFSDEYSFDSATHGVCSKGLKTDVLVMSKYKLAEYEGQRKVSGIGFFVENESGVRRFPFFMSNTWKGTIAGIILCFLLGIAGVICGIRGRGFLDKKIVDFDEGNGRGENIAAEVMGNSVPLAVEEKECLSSIFFDAVRNANGTIDFFEWESDGFIEKISASVYGAFPENFSELKQNNVTYENGIPHMNVSFSERCGSGLVSGRRTDVESGDDNFSDFPKNLRSAILLSGGGLCEEKSSPYHIDFLCQTGGQVQECLGKINGLVGEAGGAVCGLSVRRTGNNAFQVGLSIEDRFFYGFDLSLIYENIFLFKNMTETKSPAPVKTVAAIHKVSDKENQLKKIGQIRRPDNSLVIYYKGENGKIEQIIQKSEVGK